MSSGFDKDLTPSQQYDRVINSVRAAILAWSHNMTQEVRWAPRMEIEERAPWLDMVAMINLVAAGSAIVAPPAGAALSVPLAVLNTASGAASIPFMNGLKLAKSEMAQHSNNIMTQYLSRIDRAALKIKTSDHTTALAKGITDIVAGDKRMIKDEHCVGLIDELLRRSQVIPTNRQTVQEWVETNYTGVYQKAALVYRRSAASGAARRAGQVILTKGEGAAYKEFLNQREFKDHCLSYDFARSKALGPFDSTCADRVFGAKIKSDQDFLYLLTNIWLFKVKKRKTVSAQSTMHSMPNLQEVTHLEVEALPRSSRLGTPKMWQRHVAKDLQAIQRAYNSIGPQKIKAEPAQLRSA